jgi:hypothetical protein
MKCQSLSSAISCFAPFRPGWATVLAVIDVLHRRGRTISPRLRVKGLHIPRGIKWIADSVFILSELKQRMSSDVEIVRRLISLRKRKSPFFKQLFCLIKNNTHKKQMRLRKEWDSPFDHHESAPCQFANRHHILAFPDSTEEHKQ